jgi:hypothetical protein
MTHQMLLSRESVRVQAFLNLGARVLLHARKADAEVEANLARPRLLYLSNMTRERANRRFGAEHSRCRRILKGFEARMVHMGEPSPSAEEKESHSRTCRITYVLAYMIRVFLRVRVRVPIARLSRHEVLRTNFMYLWSRGKATKRSFDELKIPAPCGLTP